MNFDKIKVSQVLQVIQEDLKFNKALILHNPRKKERLYDAFHTVSNTYNELFDLNYSGGVRALVNLTINEFICEIRENSDDTNIDENEQVIDVLKYELIEYIDANNLFLKKFLSVEQSKNRTIVE
tara:strand:- start:595 stop:969 length:375 start_codon:yes stop_codon:yes gene_type:complete